MTAPAEPRVCARCKEPKPLAAYDEAPAGGLFKNCRSCKEAEAAWRTEPKVPKPDGWRVPAPGTVAMKRCEACNIEKVYSAFPNAFATICRDCVVDAREQAAPAAKTDDSERPTAYTPALGAAIAERIAGGQTLRSITADPSMPSKDTLARWRMEHEDLAEMLALARGARADARADEIADLVEAVRTGRVDPQAGRVAIDGLRWLASKDDPRRYGDKVELSNPDGSLKGSITAAVAIEALIAALPDLAGGKAPEAPTADDGADGAAGVAMAPAASADVEDIDPYATPFEDLDPLPARAEAA